MSTPLPEYVEKAVAAALEASPDVSALCAGRVYPLKLPQGALFPAVVYRRTQSAPHQTLAGYTGETVTVTVNSYAMTYEEVKALALAARRVMASAPLGAVLSTERDVSEDGVDAFCVSAEYLCQQYGGFCK